VLPAPIAIGLIVTIGVTVIIIIAATRSTRRGRSHETESRSSNSRSGVVAAIMPIIAMMPIIVDVPPVVADFRSGFFLVKSSPARQSARQTMPSLASIAPDPGAPAPTLMGES
jgi:hypothetical protein